jgi:eukaryotic-like serine/threonine-protein kinase
VSDEKVMGRFRIEERIGSGGMGTVYRAFDERLQRSVAVKEIEHAGAQRVLREAQAAARLNHPAIVTLYELGERDGHALLVSELVDGRTLDCVARDGSISDRDVARIGADLCDALMHAHGRGVVHRDVKPQNAMVRPWDTSGRRAKLMDFGIAALAGAPTLTAAGEVVGTLAYMAPEQAEGDHAGPEADVYSLGLTLYEAWAGENPVARRTPAQTARQIGMPVRSLAELRPDLPEPLVTQIDACLEADPRHRPSLDRLHRALDRTALELDDECAVPAPDGVELPIPARSMPRIAAMVGSAVALAALAGPVGMPGAALVLALLLLPALFLISNPLLAVLPYAAVPLGAIGALAGAPALIAVLAGRTWERAILGGIAFSAYLAGAITIGAGSRLGIAGRAPDGWESSASVALNDVVVPLLEPTALLGVAVLAAGSVVLGFMLRAHPALALIGAMIWSAALAAGLETVGNGAQGRNATLAVAAAGIAVAVEAARRQRERRSNQPRPQPLASAQPALHGGG